MSDEEWFREQERRRRAFRPSLVSRFGHWLKHGPQGEWWERSRAIEKIERKKRGTRLR